MFPLKGSLSIQYFGRALVDRRPFAEPNMYDNGTELTMSKC